MAFYNTFANYVGDDSTTDFAIPFSYIAESDVVVTRQGGAVSYIFLNPSTIQLSAPLATGDSLRIARATSLDEKVVVFSNGSPFTAGNMNAGFSQLFNAVQESNDVVGSQFEIAVDGSWDALTKRIVNTSDPVDQQDVATKEYVDNGAASGVAAAAGSAAAALASETAAAASASTASTQAGIATTQAGIATTQAGIATTQAGAASTSATTASTQAGTATTQATAAGVSATAANASAVAAAASAGAASTSASGASTSAGTATTQATAAGASATAADASAIAADASATAAGASEGAADASAIAAGAYESAAAASAGAASTSAGTATTQASNASGSASAANTSAIAAAASESAASTSAGTATTQAGIATTQAGIATTQAGTATTQATNASGSASAADASAIAAAASESAASTSAGTATTQAGTATTQAGTATTQAGIATTQAGTATTQAGTATTQAGIATTQATNASGFATAADASATAAAASAGSASTSADTATTQATAADASATAAAASAGAASTSETNAATSAGTATTQATAAGGSATAAAASAGTATTQATNASGSAVAAGASATAAAASAGAASTSETNAATSAGTATTQASAASASAVDAAASAAAAALAAGTIANEDILSTDLWDYASGAYETEFYNASYGTSGSGIDVSSNGGYLFVASQGYIYRYPLATKGDVSTAATSPDQSYDLSLAAVRSIDFDPTGTKLLILANTGFFLYELTIPWDLTSASYNGSNTFFDATHHTGTQYGLRISPDGINLLFVQTAASDYIYQYTLGTAWNLTTAALATSKSLTGISANPAGLGLSEDGMVAFISDYSVNYIRVCTMSTAFDVSTLTLAASIDVSANTTGTMNISVGDSSGKIYVLSDTDNKIKQYAIPPVLTLGSEVIIRTDATKDYTDARYVSDGSTYEYVGSSINSTTISELVNDTHNVYPDILSTELWDYARGAYDTEFSLGGTAKTSLYVSPDGNYMFSSISLTVYRYPLSVKGDISTASTADQSYVMSGVTTRSVDFDPTGTKLLVLSNSGFFLHELTIPWDLTTATYDGSNTFFDGAIHTPSEYGLRISPDGVNLFFLRANSVKVLYQFTLSTPWKLNTATLTTTKSLTGLGGTMFGFDISKDGRVFFISDYSASTVIVNTVTTPFDITTLTSVASIDVLETALRPINCSVGDSSGKIYVINYLDGVIGQYAIPPALTYGSEIVVHDDATKDYSSARYVSNGSTYEYVGSNSLARMSVMTAEADALSTPNIMRRKYIDVADYVSSDDTVDCDAGIRQAFKEGHGREILFSNPYGKTRRYKLTTRSNGTIFMPKKARIIGGPGAVIDFSAWGRTGTADILFENKGTLGTARLLSADGVVGAKSVTLATGASDFARGDLAHIGSTEDFTVEDGSLGKKGEFIIVDYVLGSTVYFQTPLRDTYDYLTYGAALKLVDPIDVTIDDLYMEGPGRRTATAPATAVDGDRCMALELGFVKIYGGQYAYGDKINVMLTNIYGGIVDGTKFIMEGYTSQDSGGNTNTATQYNLAINNACMDMKVNNIHTTGGTDSVSLSGTGTTLGVARGTVLSNVTAVGAYRVGIGTHDTHEDLTVDKLHAINCEAGLEIRTRKTKFTNSTVINTGTGSGTLDCAVFFGNGFGEFEGSNNTFYDVLRGYRLSADITHEFTPGKFTSDGDVMRGVRAHGITFENTTANTAVLDEVNVFNMVVEGDGSSLTTGIQLEGKWKPMINGLICRNGNSSGRPLYFHATGNGAGTSGPTNPVLRNISWDSTFLQPLIQHLSGRLDVENCLQLDATALPIIASGSAITLPINGNVFSVTGTTTINTINFAANYVGKSITLIFVSALTLTHGTGTNALRLTGAASKSATVNDVITLVSDGTTWRQMTALQAI
jgi:hypothetical protein